MANISPSNHSEYMHAVQWISSFDNQLAETLEAQETEIQEVAWVAANRNHLIYWNPLSTLWTWEQIKAHPARYLFVYPLGMIGYALALPVRIGIFVYTFFQTIVVFLVALCSGNFRLVGDSSLVFLGATGELVSGVIGMVCPPIAYKIDEWIQSNPTIHRWYKSRHLSLWSFEAQGRQVVGGDVGLGAIGNEERIENLKNTLEDYIPCVKEAKEQLKELFLESEIDAMSATVLKYLATFGILNAVLEEKSMQIFIDKAKQSIREGDLKEQKLQEDLAEFDRYLKILVEESIQEDELPQASQAPNQMAAKAWANYIRYVLILEAEDSTFLEGAQTKEHLSSILSPLAERKLILANEETSILEILRRAGQAILRFSNDVTSTNREIEIVLTQGAYT
jgi:hypothetical protein